MNKTKLYLNIDDYLSLEITISAMDLCSYLIEIHGFSDKLFSTGRPRLYLDVVIYLQKLEKNGILIPIEKDRDNCKYRLVSSQINSEEIIEKQIIEDTQEKKTQLSLF